MIAGRYSLDREIGRGGMGAVWLGRDEVLGRAVAMKQIGMMPGGTTPDLERAEREARLAARLNHPHVVAIFDLVTEDDHQWLVMEYVDGATLAELVRSGGPLAPEEAAPLLSQVADALTAAHTAGIIHRDVKPSNILVTPTGQVKLSDFGIARAEADASLTQTGLVTGSPAYLAPEVASGSSATEASDVWSLGATLFHALAGHPPYDVGDNLLGALYRIVHEEPPRLATAGWLSPLLAATMTRDPASRWTMAQVGDFLKAGPQLAHVLPLPAPQATVSPDPDGTQVLSRTAPAIAPTPTLNPARHRRGRLVPFLIGGVAVVLMTVIAFAVVLSGGDQGDPPTASPTPTGSAPSVSDGPIDDPTEAGMTSFIEDYLATVTSDPALAWTRLTSDFQDQSGGFETYDNFWSDFDSANVTEVSADTESLQVTYQVDYLRNSGPRESSDNVTLQLVYADGTYLINDER